jgi:site-specific DNA-methyltransferase (adenine-specific)
VKQPEQQKLENQGKSWSGEEKQRVFERYKILYQKLGTKRDSIKILSEEFGRGRFSLQKIIREME